MRYSLKVDRSKTEGIYEQLRKPTVAMNFSFPPFEAAVWRMQHGSPDSQYQILTDSVGANEFETWRKSGGLFYWEK